MHNAHLRPSWLSARCCCLWWVNIRVVLVSSSNSQRKGDKGIFQILLPSKKESKTKQNGLGADSKTWGLLLSFWFHYKNAHSISQLLHLLQNPISAFNPSIVWKGSYSCRLLSPVVLRTGLLKCCVTLWCHFCLLWSLIQRLKLSQRLFVSSIVFLRLLVVKVVCPCAGVFSVSQNRVILTCQHVESSC